MTIMEIDFINQDPLPTPSPIGAYPILSSDFKRLLSQLLPPCRYVFPERLFLSLPRMVGSLQGTLDLLVVSGTLWRAQERKPFLTHRRARREYPREAEQVWCGDAQALQPQPLPVPSDPSAISCAPLSPFQDTQSTVAARQSN